MIDEGFVEDEAGLGLDPAGTSALDPRTTALLQVAASVALGSPAVCLEWSAARALAAGGTEDEIADVLLAIAPVAGSAGSLPPLPMWRPGSGMTSRPRWRTRTINDGSAATATEAGMTTDDQPGRGWTVVLRRQPARIMEGRQQAVTPTCSRSSAASAAMVPAGITGRSHPGSTCPRPYPITNGVAATGNTSNCPAARDGVPAGDDDKCGLTGDERRVLRVGGPRGSEPAGTKHRSRPGTGSRRSGRRRTAGRSRCWLNPGSVLPCSSVRSSAFRAAPT
jgi:carboxymuconolactone decarboxylase family protein